MSASDSSTHSPGIYRTSVRQVLCDVLREAQTEDGRFLPLTAAELLPLLAISGFVIPERDVESSLQELVGDGNIVQIDAAGGFRWNAPY